MRAAVPAHEGTVECNGAHIAYEVYGPAGAPTVLLTQTWQIIHSRHWKFTIPFLSRHYRVVTYDPVGNGKSDRIYDTDRYGDRSQLDDALAVLSGLALRYASEIGAETAGIDAAASLVEIARDRNPASDYASARCSSCRGPMRASEPSRRSTASGVAAKARLPKHAGCCNRAG